MQLLRTLVIPAVIAVAGVTGFASQASAKCEVTGQMFVMHLNDETKQNARTDKDGCDLHFVTTSKTRFQSVKIVKPPENGTLRKIAALEFRYRPKADFVGTDKFTVNVCGWTLKGRGCSTLNYEAQIEK